MAGWGFVLLALVWALANSVRSGGGLTSHSVHSLVQVRLRFFVIARDGTLAYFKDASEVEQR